MSEEQQPCPFCGSTNGAMTNVAIVGGGSTVDEYRWNCANCGALGPHEPSGGACNWNRRHAPTAGVGLSEKERGALETASVILTREDFDAEAKTIDALLSRAEGEASRTRGKES